MASFAPTGLESSGPGAPRSGRGRTSSIWTWRWSDRIIFLGAWVAGLGLCLIAAAIVLYFAVRGIQYLRPSLLVTRPQASLSQAGSGGFLDPLIGTALVTVIGMVVAIPLSVASAFWLVEYGRPTALARVVESCIEIVAGTPDILIAIFILAFFQIDILAPFSSTSGSGAVSGQSFIAAGAGMSLLAVPPIFVATRDGLQTVPAHLREAAFALGKTRIATIRRVLLPSVRSNIATGSTLGISRIIGDTAIVLIVLGGTLRLEPQGSVPGWNVLTGIGSTLTGYVHDNSPAGEGGAAEKAYAAAFVLLLFVVLLNALVGFISRAQQRGLGLDSMLAP